MKKRESEESEEEARIALENVEAVTLANFLKNDQNLVLLKRKNKGNYSRFD